MHDESTAQAPSIDHEEQKARLVWAIHILSYLTNGRAQKDLQESVGFEDEENIEDFDFDVETEKNVVLSGSHDFIRYRFLDCVAQLLSPSKGWSGVTATALREREDWVEIDVARNDGFIENEKVVEDSRKSGKTSQDRAFDPNPSIDGESRQNKEYLQHLKEFLSLASPDEKFECQSILYTAERTEYWANQLQELLQSETKVVALSACFVITPASSKSWKEFSDVVSDVIGQKSSRDCIKLVQQAYEFTVCEEVRKALLAASLGDIGLKAWRILKSMARPISDCRMLQSICCQYPQFRDVRFKVIYYKPAPAIDVKYQIDVAGAWTQLSPHVPLARAFVSKFKKRFKKHCKKAFALHAEIQLSVYYQANPHLLPDLPYFGCSKKACILCNEFLKTLATPIVTRGQHGMCYPAWGVPLSSSDDIKTALATLDHMLVVRITKIILQSTSDNLFQPAVAQSTLPPSISSKLMSNNHSTTSIAEQTKELRRLRLIIEGATVLPPSTKSGFDPSNSCLMCNKLSAECCKICLSSYYCSEICKKADWPSHQLLCRTFSALERPPSDSHRLAIYFPVDQEKPRLIWIPVYKHRTWDELRLHQLFGADHPLVGGMNIEHNPIRHRNLGMGFVTESSQKGYAIRLIYRDTFLIDGSNINKSLLATIQKGTSGSIHSQWCGPIIAMRLQMGETYGDIKAADLRHLLDYLTMYNSNEVSDAAVNPEQCGNLAVLGVRICSLRAQLLFGSDAFVPVNIPTAHPIRNSRVLGPEGEVSSISRFLGKPLRLWREPDNEYERLSADWESCGNSNDSSNAAMLMMETNIEHPRWGFIPRDWILNPIENVLAVRTDDTDLTVEDVKLMCEFARLTLQPMFEDALGLGLVHRTRQEVVDFITWENLIRSAQERSEAVKHTASHAQEAAADE